jgi:tyrosine-protein kinase Etk/Wzc
MALNPQKQLSSAAGDLNDILSKVVKYWYVFVIAILVSLALANLYLKNATRLYKVTSTLLIQNDFKGDGLLKGTAFSDLDMFRGARTVDNEMEVLRSRDLIYKTLKELSLETNYSIPGVLNNKELYGEELPVRVIVEYLNDQAYSQVINLSIQNEDVFALQTNGKNVLYSFDQVITRPGYKIRVIKGPAFSSTYPSIKIGFKDLYSMAEHYSLSALTIVPIVKDANTVSLSLLDAIPQRGVDILNQLITTYNEENVNTKNMVAKNTIRFIDQRLIDLNSDLSVLEHGVENYKQVNRVTNMNADSELNLRTSGDYDLNLSSSGVQLDLIRSLVQYLGKNDSQYEIVPSTLGIKDLTLNNLINKYNDLQIERQRLSRNNNPDNPLIVNINEQLAGLRGYLQETLKNVQAGLTLERNNLLDKSNQFESKIRNVPVVERGLLQLSRDQDVKAAIYQYLLQKREETALSLSATIPTSLIIDRPAYNTVPAKPKEALIYLGSLLTGFLFPLFFFSGREKLNTKVKYVTDVQLLGDTRILGELSHKEENNTVVVKRGSRTTISELFRYIQSNLGYIINNTKSQILLVTSGMKGEGKTFFSINLGITLALAGKKVIIVEFDLRKPDLMKGINMKYEKGLADYLENRNVEIDEIIKPSAVSSNLSVIGCGKLPDDPTELFSSEKMDGLFLELRKKYDYIILDTSPVGQVADAFNIAPYADASIYLVRYNFTERGQLSVLDDICENKKLKNLMIVFNDAKKDNMRTYGYGNAGQKYAESTTV